MRRFLSFICVCFIAASASVAAAQSTPVKSGDAKPAEKNTEKSSTAGTNLPTEATVEGFLQQTFGYQAGLSWKIASVKPVGATGLAEVSVVIATPQGQQLSRFYVTADGQHALTGELIPFGAKPFDPAKKLLEKGISGPERGPKNAPVMMVEFGDLQCPACKAAQPTIEALVAAEPTARFVFQNFPLDMHNWAAKGAAYADCVGRASNDAFWKFVSKTYETQSDITAENSEEKLTAVADGVGVQGADIPACAIAPDTKARVDASVALGKEVEITGTPTLFVNGRRIGNLSQIPADTLKSLVDFAAK